MNRFDRSLGWERAIAGAFLASGLALGAILVSRPVVPTHAQVEVFLAQTVCERAKAAHRLIYPMSRCVAAEIAHPEDDDR